MGEARHSVMLLGEEFGVHLPRALTTFIAGLGPLGAALEAAFPFLAIIVGATLLLRHLEEMREAGAKLTDDQVRFGTAIQNAFNTLDTKITQAQIKSDELRNDHLGALKLQLELIDKQSMSELVHAFDEVAKAADVVMKDLEGHWYTVGIGSDGATHALNDFQTQYDSLLAQGKDEAASGLLKGTLSQAQKVLALQQEGAANSGTLLKGPSDNADISKSYEAQIGLKKMGVGWTEKEVKAQEALVQSLTAQVDMEAKVAELKKLDSSNATKTTGNEAAAQAAAAARQAAESQLRMGEQSVSADRASADAQLTIHRASLEQRLASDLDFAGRDRDVKEAANQAEIAALDRSGKDYQNQLKALNEKTLEIDNEYTTKTAELKAKASVEVYSRDLERFEQSEREKIEATQQGSTARLAVIDGAIKEEQSRNLQDTNFFRELLNMRVETTQQEAEEEGKLRQDAAKEDAENTEKMGALSIQAEKQHMALMESARRVTIAQQIADDTTIANDEYALKMSALGKKIAGLDKSGKEYNNNLKQLQDQEKQQTQQHEDELTAIKEKAQQQSNQRILAADTQFQDSLARGLTQSIMGHQTWSKMLLNLGDQVVGGMIQNAIKSMLADDMTKEKDAAKAARSAFNIGLSIGGPVGIILGPVMGAAAFAAVMAFATGTDRVPGVTHGDTVPAMLTPGEGVVPGGVMDGLRNMARNGGFDQGPRYTIHAPIRMSASVMDADGVDKVFTQHSDRIQKHFENTLRRMNH
jgi:hypothetical protein